MPSHVIYVTDGNIRHVIQLDTEYLKCADFLLADIRVGDQRHIIFATEYQRNLLCHARRWFMDEKRPIDAFIQMDGMKKQLPLVFALMSRKTEADYVAVLTAIKEKILSLTTLCSTLSKLLGWLYDAFFLALLSRVVCFTGHRLFGEKSRTLG
ncbi:hypothetical protein DPMN_101624 [Dreissena polymorpha]|uniref:Uncharacterized protein n=1 Tax=Dreissena polymorpha TaxID=45954 RepID=A0A9D4LJS6_DREPO|nr:hypothetical protein DPMN_101624 [Dreissena polymorpha]